jgi:uncharacterized protein YcnI
MKTAAFIVLALIAATPAWAHIVVAPPQSQPGASQVYTVRVHNEEKVATTSVELDVPDGVTVVSVAPVAGGTFTTEKTGDRIVTVTWKLDIPAGKYVELAFTATNPASATQVNWNVHQRMADGTLLDWSDKAGAHGKASITKIAASPAAAAAPAH